MLNYAQFIPCTIDHTQVTADAVDFPHLILISDDCGTGDSDLTVIFDELGTDCLKLSVAYTNDVEMYTEIATWDAVNEIGELYSEMTISSAADTEYRIYFDADADDNTSYVGVTGSTPAKAVWNSGYAAVYHMNDNPADSTQILDSTANANTGTKGAGAAAPTEVDGLVGKAQYWDGTVNKYINLTDIDTTDTTVEYAINIESYTGSSYAFPVAKGYATLSNRSWSSSLRSGFSIFFARRADNTGYNYALPIAGDTPITGTEYIFADVIKSSDYIKRYRDGVEKRTNDITGVAHPYQSNYIVTIGDAYGSDNLNATISETRISNVARSTDWISLTNKSLTDALNTFGGICYKASFSGKTLRTVKKASSFGGKTLRVVKQVSDFGGVTLRKVIAESSFSGQTLRTVKALSGYSAATLRTVTRAAPPPATKYAIELRTAAGALKQIFEAAYGVSHTQVVNEPHTLTFNLRGTDPKRSDIRWPYEFWLRNMVTGSVVNKFILTGESDSDSRNNLTTQINASSLLAQLGMETLQSDLTITDTVENICIELLTHQRLTPAITLGTIEITTEVSMSWTGHPTLLACINNLLDAVGGYLDVNDDRELDWLDDVGEDKGQQIRQGKNIVALKQDRDWMSFATVLYPVGNSIKLSDKSMSMEVATKSADATYGYLTVPTDYVCFNEDTLEILSKGDKENVAAFDVIANVSQGTDWDVVSGDAAYWLETTGKLRDGNDTSSRLGFRWTNARWFSGLDFMVTQFNTGVASQTRIRRIVIEYTTNAFTTILPAWDSGVVYDLGDGTNAFDVDFGQRFYGNGLSIKIYTYTPIGGTIADYIAVILSVAGPAPVGTIEYFDESASWTNINDRQLSIPIASYHADDTYYLTYTLADYLKDLTAIATWSDEDGNGGEVSRSQTFNYADDVDTLLQWGQVYLPTVSYPPTTYHLQAALLNEVHANFSFDELQKGSIVAVVHDDLGITVNARVLRINQPDLFNSPAEADIDISSQPKTLADAFRALWDRI